tara:strand:+ start:207 stop:449 length:243 start_codon:yes stop_codon:yes gene_type:complete
MREVKVRFSESDLEILDNLAKENNTTRADIIRSKVHSSGIGSTALHSVSTAIRSRTFGLTRQQAEHAAAVAISTLANASR